MTQEELADRLGVSRQTIYKWENEMSYPDITNINNLCDIFDVTSDYLIRGIEDKKQARQIDAMIFAIIALGIDILALIIIYGFLCSDVVYSMTSGIDVNNIIPVYPDIPDQHNARWLAFHDKIVIYRDKIRSII